MGRLGRGRRVSEEGAGCTEERSPEELFQKTKRWELGGGGRWTALRGCEWTRASPGGLSLAEPAESLGWEGTLPAFKARREL